MFRLLAVAQRRTTLAEAVDKLAGDGLTLQMIDNRGVKVWPAGRAETFCTDSFRCRFMAEGAPDVAQTAGSCSSGSPTRASTSRSRETLRDFDGKAGFTLAQGQ